MQPTSIVERLFCCKNRFGVNPGKCFSNVDCVSGLNGLRAPHDGADNIECSWKCNIIVAFFFENVEPVKINNIASIIEHNEPKIQKLISKQSNFEIFRLGRHPCVNAVALNNIERLLCRLKMHNKFRKVENVFFKQWNGNFTWFSFNILFICRYKFVLAPQTVLIKSNECNVHLN